MARDGIAQTLAKNASSPTFTHFKTLKTISAKGNTHKTALHIFLGVSTISFDDLIFEAVPISFSIIFSFARLHS